jgi:hypothetical protein
MAIIQFFGGTLNSEVKKKKKYFFLLQKQKIKNFI